MSINLPAWLEEVPAADRVSARSRFLIRAAALHWKQDAKLYEMSEALGLAHGSLAQLNTISAELAIKLETLLGKEDFPRSLFCPEIFEA